MTRSTRRRVTRASAAVIVAVCAVTLVVTLQDRDDVVAAEEASVARAAADARRAGADASRAARLHQDVIDVRGDEEADRRAARRVGDVADQVRVLRLLLARAQTRVLDVQRVSSEQQGQLDVLRRCVDTLDRVRAALAGGDVAAATLHLAAGREACARAEAVADGIIDAVHPFDFPDPDVIEADGTYYAFGTNGPGGTIQVLSSSDLADWQVQGSALSEVAPWALPGQTWAPAVLRTFDGYRLYYAARHRDWGQQCLSVAHSSSPTGPYVDTSPVPITCQTDYGGSIDPSPYVGEDGGLYLTWKSEGETIGSQSVIWAARLDPRGQAIVGASVPLLITDRPWEGRVVEAPTMRRMNGTWVLLYSGNDWRTGSYSTGYARCLGPLGPCAKPADNVVLRSGDRVHGPGGAGLFRSRDGRTMIAFAGWDAGQVGPPNPRRLHLAELHLTPDTLTAR